MSKKQENEQSLEMQLLLEKIKNLEAKVAKPKNSDEEFQERIAKYEANKEKREAQKAEIEKRRMEILSKNPRMRQDEAILMESWERRAREVEATNPEFADQLKAQMKFKVKEVNEDYSR